MPLSCRLAQRRISAALDGEVTPAEQQRVDSHLAECASCKTWSDAAVAVGRSLRVRAAVPVTDLAPLIAVARVRSAGPAAMRLGVTRALLVIMALIQVYLTVPVLLSHQHEGHHLAAFDLALACAVAFAAFRPALSLGIMPFLVVLGAGLFVTTAMDIANGETHTLSEIPHIMVLIEGALIWRMQQLGIPRARPPRRPAVADQTITQIVESA